MAYIRGLGTYIPDGRITAAEIAEASGLPEWVLREKMGLESKTVPGPEDGTAAMAVRAGRRALSDAGIEATDVDVVVSMVEEHKEYPVWYSGPYLARELGASRAWAFDVNQKCGTFMAALAIAEGLLAAQEDVETVLIAGGYRNGDLIDFTDPNVRFMYDLSAGGGAAVVSATGPGMEVLSTAFLTDAELSNCVLVPVGGTERPGWAAEGDEFYLRVTDPELMKGRLSEHSMANFERVMLRALEKAGLGREDVDYLALLHMKRSANRAVLDALGLKEEQSVYLKEYGHIGQIDQILSLELAREQGRFGPGQVAVLASAGVGYTWNASVVRWVK